MKKFRTSLLQFLSLFDDWELIQNVPQQSVFDFYYSPKHKLYIHLVELDKRLKICTPDFFQQISLHCYHHKIKLIQLREEQWLEKREFIEHRLQAILETNKKIHARQCKTKRIEKKEYDLFLNQHHLLQTASTRYKYGLYKGEELMAVMGISAGRWMTKEGDLRKSYEIIRFATKTNCTVVGGFSKLLIYIEQELQVQEWMTYYDLDWVQSNVYSRLGFELKQITKPETKMIPNTDKTTYTSGNLKFIKRVS
jgi:hypothetical protein